VKRIFITGASSGIGAGLARAYAAPDVTLGLVARRAALLEELAADLRGKGATVRLYAHDVANTRAMKECVEAFLDAAGGADLVIANAGVGIRSALLEGNAEDVARLMQVNVVGVTNTLVPFVPAMVRQKSGVLVAISSMAGHRALPGRAAYSASKAAVITFMDGLRMDLHGTGVHAMTICPGFVKTPMLDGLKGKLPFLVDLDDAVATIRHAIEHRERTFTFPWQMNMLRHVLTRAPEWLVRKSAPKPRSRGTIG
jgi:hypothetical protein